MKSTANSRFWVADVSNSWTKLAQVTKNELGRVIRMPTSDLRVDVIRQLSRKKARGLPLVLGSVVPRRTILFERHWKGDVFVVSGAKSIGVEVDYPVSKQIGADRLANAIAAKAFFGCPVIVVDFGTAVTFDVVNKAGAYCGGVIAPGLNAMTDYLHEKTALLPKIKLHKPTRAIGKSTREAMCSGAFYGYQGLVSSIASALRAELGDPKTPIVFTGGQGEEIVSGFSDVVAVNPLLTLEGLRMIGDHVYAK